MKLYNTTEITSYPIQTIQEVRRSPNPRRHVGIVPSQDSFERTTQKPEKQKKNIMQAIFGFVSLPSRSEKTAAINQKEAPQTVLPPNVADYTSVRNGVMLPKNNQVFVSNQDVLTLGRQYELDLQSPEIQRAASVMKPDDIIIVGRLGNIRVPADIECVSAKHLSLQKYENGFIVRDISLNGTQISHRKTNPNEFVRYINNQGNPIDSAYIQTSKETRNYLNNAIETGEYTHSLESYKRVMNEAHKIAYSGISGQKFWYKKHGMFLRMNPYLTRTKDGILSNSYSEESEKVANLAKQFGDKYTNKTNTIQKVYLLGIDNNSLPYNQANRHFYPSGTKLEQYYARMYKTSKEALNLINMDAPKSAILDKLAEHYQYAINARPYEQINNSLYMNEINTLLLKANMKTMPHCNLDHAAHRLQPDSFKKYFVYCYSTQGLK